MDRAIAAAAVERRRVAPRPWVGAVVVPPDPDGSTTFVGATDGRRGPHAEVVALAAAGAWAEDSTLYVTLEPCAHHGLTPPCADAVIAAGVARVVVAADDPFPRVRGGGLAALVAAGIVVETGLFEPEARRLTAAYRKLVSAGMPWVIAKWAETAAGRLTPPAGCGRWISSPESRRIVHDLRRRVDAIVVGIGTALADDPLLTARPPGSRRLCRQRPEAVIHLGDPEVVALHQAGQVEAAVPQPQLLLQAVQQGHLLCRRMPAQLGPEGVQVWRAHAGRGGLKPF